MSLKLRYWFRLVSAFANRFRGVIFAGIIAGLFMFALIRFMAPYLVSTSTEYIGITGRFHTEELPLDVLGYVGEGLTSLNENGEVEPGLAESWEESDEGRKWTFYLKKGKEWHDGTPVTSDTIQYQFEDAEIERPDEYTIVFKLSSPFAPFPSVVSKPTFKKGLLGTGEWKVRNISLASTYVETLSLANNKGSRKIFHLYPSEDSTKLAFQLGEIDKIIDLLDPEPFDDWQTVKIEKNISEDRFVALFFNYEQDPFKGAEAKPLRQALSYAIDKSVFDGPRAVSPISPNSWAYNPQVKDYLYDVDRAEDLLGGVEDLELDLTTTPPLLDVAERVAEFWGEIGIKTNVKVVSIVPSEYQAFLAIYDVPEDPDQYSIWHSTQNQSNIANYSNPRIDKLLEDGRLELDHEERKKLYLDFQRFLLEDAPAIFLYHPISYTVVRN